MTAAKVTFLGGPDAGNVGENVWGVPETGQITFPLNQSVLVDPEQGGVHKPFMEHVLRKARTNRFFRVEDVKDGKTDGAVKAHVVSGKADDKSAPTHANRRHRPA